MGKKMLLVDGNSIFRRFYHNPNKEEQKYASSNFVNFLLKKKEERKVDYLYCVFDNKGKTFRHKSYDDYKKNRVHDPEFINRLNEVALKLNSIKDKSIIAKTAPTWYEADDVIGTIALEVLKTKTQVLILTSDHDFFQLIRPGLKIEIIGMIKDEEGNSKSVIVGKEKFKELKGIEVEQFLDYKTLVGDSSDNVKGVKSVGPKTAVKLLNEYENLISIFMKGGIKDKYKLNADDDDVTFMKQVLLSKEMMRINTDVPKKYIIDGLNREI